MNERVRISLAIVGFAAVAVAFVVLGIYGFGRISGEAFASSLDVANSQLEVATPESVGLDSRRLVVVDNLVEEYIHEGAFPGAVVGVVRDGKIVYRKSFGAFGFFFQSDFDESCQGIGLDDNTVAAFGFYRRAERRRSLNCFFVGFVLIA